MADHGEDPFVERNGTKHRNLSDIEMGSDVAFTATTPANASKTKNNAATNDPTFIQNQISIQRSPSVTAAHVAALSRKLSVNSNGSHEAAGPSISGILEQGEERVDRGRKRDDSASSLIEATTRCNLTKSPSVSTHDSNKSVKSTKSVRSVHAVGSYPLGSLRVHSPSPTRPDVEARAFLKSGAVILVRDVPPGSLIGYDTKGLVVKQKGDFEGLREVPPGAHFLWGGASKNSLRSGFWIMIPKKGTDELGEIHVKRWDKDTETLDEVRRRIPSLIQIRAFILASRVYLNICKTRKILILI